MRLNKLLMFFCVLWAAMCHADPAPRPTAEQVAMERLKFDQTVHEFNRSIEKEKLEIERLKSWITGISYTVPLMVAAVSFLLGVRNQAEQSRLQRESQEKTSLAQFELKAAEIVLAERGPVGTLNKARTLKAIFPRRLPEDFVAKLNPADFQSKTGEGSLEAKIKFFEIVSKETNSQKELALLWRKLFPGDTWTDRVAGRSDTNQGDS